jgi:hypothetical protein
VTFERKLIIGDVEHFTAALAFQQEIIQKQGLKEVDRLDTNLNYLLGGYYGRADSLTLHKDFVPHSFEFVFRLGDRIVMNGGIILHGAGETFTVTLDQGPPRMFWSVHT